MTYVSESEFWRLHTANRHTSRYKALLARKMEEVGYRCCVCHESFDDRPWRLEMDHKRYRKDGQLIFGREQLEDFRVRCHDCHAKGPMTPGDVAEQRAVLRWQRMIEWPFRLLWGLLGFRRSSPRRGTRSRR